MEDAVRFQGIRGLSIDITLESHVMPQQVSLKIFDALTRNAQIDARRITVTAHDHTIALSGSVRSWAEREEVEAAAWSAPGVTAVENQIRVTA